MTSKLDWLLLTVAVACGIGCGNATDGHSHHHSHEPAPPPAPSMEDPDEAFAARIAELDRQIAAAETEAERRPDDWIQFERIASLYLERARLSGDWNDFVGAERSLDRAFENAPDGAGPHLSRASFNYTLHRLARVSPDLDAVEGYAVLYADKRIIVKSLRADVAFHSGDYDEARRLYDEIADEARTPMALTALAQWHWKTADFARAEALLAEADELASTMDDGTRAWLALVRGLMALDRGRWDEALGHYERGLALVPGYWLLEEHIAEILTLRGDIDRALPLYESLVERTNNPEFMDAIAQIELSRGRPEAAAPWIERARAEHETRIALYPEAAYGHALDHWLVLEEDSPRTVAMAEANVEARPGGEAKTKLALAYLAADRVDDARRVIEEVLATRWSTAETHATAAAIYARLGDTTSAARERERALALDPHAFGPLPRA